MLSRFLFLYSVEYFRDAATEWMQAAADEKAARPESHPKKVVFLAALPPVDSTKERLGRRRQSKPYASETSRNTGESSAAGQWPCSKKARRKPSRGSLLGSGRCSAVAGLEAVCGAEPGMETTPAKTAKPFESSLRIRIYLVSENLVLKERPKMKRAKKGREEPRESVA